MAASRSRRVIVTAVGMGLTIGVAWAGDAPGPAPGIETGGPVAPPLADPGTRERRLAMGTIAEISVRGLADPTPALDAAYAALALVDERMSLWKQSELAALNREGRGVVSPETFAVIRHALDVAAASDGAFDPTVEPLVRARGGFGGVVRPLEAVERNEALARIDHRRVTLDASTRTVRLAGGARLVLDAIAKGDAADRALVALREAGATSGLVDLGGSTLAVFGEPVTVDVRDPLGDGREIGRAHV